MIRKLWKRIQTQIQLSKMKLTAEKKWISVFQSREPYSIEIRKMKLEDEGIATQVWNNMDSSYNTFGYIHLNVKLDDETTAREIIDKLNE